MITISKIGYWEMAYFLAPTVATLVVEIFFSGWLMRSYDATLLGELSLTYVFFTWIFSCPLGCIAIASLPLLNTTNPPPVIYSLIFIAVTLILGYIQWFYLLPKWIKWRRQHSKQ